MFFKHTAATKGGNNRSGSKETLPERSANVDGYFIKNTRNNKQGIFLQ